MTLKGNVKWAKVYDPDVYAGASNWKVNFYPADEKEWGKYETAQLQLVKKEDIDGKYIVFRRPTQKLIGDNLVVFSPPEITGKVSVRYVDAEGNKVRQYNKGDKVKIVREGEPELIGNGSLVLVNFSYYNTAKGAGHRLEGLNILEHVEVVQDGDGRIQDKDDTPVKEEIKTETKSLKEELNDDLPW